MRLLPLLKYRMRDLLRGLLIMVLVIAALLAVFTFINTMTSGEVSGNVTTSSIFGIAIFVFGITAVREDMRIGIQNGAGRGTSFLASLISFVILGAAMAVVNTVGGSIWNRFDTGVGFTSLSTMIFFEKVIPTNTEEYLASLMVTFSAYIFFSTLGSFISLMYWRLSKLGKWLVSLGFGVAFLLLISVGTTWRALALAVGRFLDFTLASPANLSCTLTLTAALLTALAYLVARRNTIAPSMV